MNPDFEYFSNNLKDRIVDFAQQEIALSYSFENKSVIRASLGKLLEVQPLSVAIPSAFGGRGIHIKECLQVLSTAAYYSLPLSLTFGINLGLFLEPLAKYGHQEVQKYVFDQFLHHQAMGGLMITEPEFGTDALNIRTYFEKREGGYHLKGTKHWQGLTGLANFWIIAARKEEKDNSLSRDISFFVAEDNHHGREINVTQSYKNLGLHFIPYGLNEIDIQIPEINKFRLSTTGIKTMLDILHRSRMQFPGMGMGFITRMLDETLSHCRERKVGKKPLSALDSVKFRISKLESNYTLCSGMCARSAAICGIENDLSDSGLEANSMKAVVTELMQESAQIALQLSGANGYKVDHIVGKGFVDSLPFQIFEGPNEVLYAQIAKKVLHDMAHFKDFNLYTFLKEHSPLCSSVASEFQKHLQFSLPHKLPQRKLITLGKAVARLICFQYVFNLTERGFRAELYDNSRKHIEVQIQSLLSGFTEPDNAHPISDYREGSNWADFA